MKVAFEELTARLRETGDLVAAAALLSWDQQTYMPRGAAQARGRQLATLDRLAHDKLADPAVGRLLDELEPWAEGQGFDSDEAGLVRATRRAYERAACLPSEFVGRLSEHQAASFVAWAEARPKNDFPAVRPFLEKTLELSREYSSFFPGREHVADPLIDRADYGMTASTLRELFGRLRGQLVPLVQAITALPAADDSCLQRTFPRVRQEAFLAALIEELGYDLHCGRVDVSPHPMTTGLAVRDVRITVRYKENDLGEALFSAIHEAGHAMYEQGCTLAYDGTPLAGGTSAGVHESQSRLWENLVGRSRGFWSHYYPKLQAAFPGVLDDVTAEAFYRAINRVERSLIRTDADEVTYNLHVILRFGLELDLLEGKLAVRDLPDAWRERFRADLGIAPSDDRDGVLQDIHWYFAFIGGMFQGYTLGNILGAQFYEAAVQAHPEIPSEIELGRSGTLLGWLRDNIYRHGSKYTTAELVQRVTGGPLRIEPYIRYLTGKYGELYGI